MWMGPRDLVERNGAAGEQAVEIEAPDGGEDVPYLGPRLAREFGRSKVATEKSARRAVGHAGEIRAGEGVKERVCLLDAAGRG